jgi:hypothetical protein
MSSIISSLFKGSVLARSAKHLVYESDSTKIADIVIDASLNEIIQYGATITEHPIETRSSVSDHIFKNPLKLKIEGYITDSPMKIMGIFETPLQKNSLKNMKRNIKNALPFFESDKPSTQSYLALKTLFNEKSLITVVSKLEAFHDMAITNLTFTSNNETVGKLDFVAELTQVTHARVEVTNISRTKNKTLSNLTAKVTDGGNGELGKSALKSAYDWFSN